MSEQGCWYCDEGARSPCTCTTDCGTVSSPTGVCPRSALPPSEQHPVYAKIPEASGSNLFILQCDEGWRTTVVASGMYEHVADWLISLIQGKPFPHPQRGVTTPRPSPTGRIVL